MLAAFDRATTARTPHIYVREMHVAQAAPSTPSSGNPAFPSTNNQLATALMTFALTRTSITGLTTLTAWRYRRSATYSKRGRVLQATSLK